MIHQNLIKRRADEDGLSAPAVERDYVLAHVLAAIWVEARGGNIDLVHVARGKRREGCRHSC